MDKIAIKFEFKIDDGSKMEQIVVFEFESDGQLERRLKEHGNKMLQLNPDYKKYEVIIGSKTDDLSQLRDQSIIWQVYYKFN